MPTDVAFLARLRIEPLDRAKHDRAAFSSGEDRVDAYFKTRAAGLMDVDGTVAWVACLDETSEVVGYYALNAHSVIATAMPAHLRKRLPAHHPIPATFLSNIATAEAYHRRGVAKYLIADAFKKAVRAADAVGSAFIILDALNEAAADLYRSLGFIALPEPPGRMIIGMRQVRAAVRAVPEIVGREK